MPSVKIVWPIGNPGGSSKKAEVLELHDVPGLPNLRPIEAFSDSFEAAFFMWMLLSCVKSERKRKSVEEWGQKNKEQAEKRLATIDKEEAADDDRKKMWSALKGIWEAAQDSPLPKPF